MLRVIMIRHGRTKGNAEHRYVGSTDEGILPEEAERLKTLRGELTAHFAVPERPGVYVSPMRRCRETAEILFPGVPQTAVPDFREMNFGAFEYRNYAELSGNPDYQRYLDSGGETAFPGGESRADFLTRTNEAMKRILQSSTGTICLVVHGGTIMAVLDRLSDPHRPYFDWQIGNGEGFSARFDGRALTDIRKIGV